MKYIDAEKLIADIRRIVVDETPISKGSDYYHGAADTADKLISFITSLQQEQPMPSCKSCGFYENNCPFIRGKFIPYPNKVCKDYIHSAMKEQEQPDTCIFGNTPSESSCKFCGVECALREPKQTGTTSAGLSSKDEAVGLAIMAYLDTKVKHDNAKVCGVSLKVAREWIREKIANKQEQPEVDLDKEEFVGVAESPLKTFPRVNDFECGGSYRH